MDSKKPYSAPHMKRPEHHLFTNNRLNRMFCATRESSALWADEGVKLFEANVIALPKEKQADLLKYIVAITEVSFEWGFRQAIDEVTDLAAATRDKKASGGAEPHQETKKNSEEPNKSRQ